MLENLSKSIFMYEHGNANASVFRGYREALDHIHNLALKEKIVVAIDEYPYLAKSEPGISSLFQVQIDHKFKNTNIFLIFCASFNFIFFIY
jgi:AAA+ ATPase superfamily predicted ATPase